MLREKIKQCLEHLDVKTVPFESIRELFQIDQSVSLILIDKTKFLLRTLEESQNRTERFYFEWFLYFLCDRSYRHTDYDQQSFCQLLDAWFNHVKANQDILGQMICKLDRMIDHLSTAQNAEDHDHRLTQFVIKMLNVCFQPGE